MNAISIAMCAIPMLISLPLQWTVLKGLNKPFELWDLLIVAIAMPLLFILHEGVHAISFMLTGAPKGSVKFGAIPKKNDAILHYYRAVTRQRLCYIVTYAFDIYRYYSLDYFYGMLKCVI